ncbi:MAG TPA: glycosyltransferase family 1 protein [Alphaproteobacteria bacterium]|nr:glycosyltransferase family 1 protein [Alphaproteobacteria bacterium]
MLACNAKILAHRIGGVQRATAEILQRLGDDVRAIAPRRRLRGLQGVAWEQAALPCLLNGSLLWSPANTGPLVVQRQVVTLHDTAFLDHPEFFTPAFAGLYRTITFPLLKRALHVTTVSEFSKRQIVHHYRIPPEKITVAPLAAGARFKPQPPEIIAALRAKLGLPGRYFMAQAACANRRKNLAGILKAWARALPDLSEDLFLVICGDAEPSPVFGKAETLPWPPRARKLEFVEENDLPAIMSGAGGFIFPSLYEGFGLPVLEAMACGTPVICSNATSLPEVAGDDALFVDPYSVDDIARALITLARVPDLDKRFSEAGLRRASKFSWDKTAATIRAVLDDYAAR